MITRIVTAFALAAVLALPVAPAFAQTTASTDDLACVQAAVEKRDGAIIAAWDVLSPAIRSALVTRQQALVAAWGINNRKERRAAIKVAWRTFRASVKSARATFRISRISAWKTWRDDVKACRPELLSDDRTSASVDAEL